MERTPFTSELPEDDTEVTPERQRRPFEVLSDWLADRQRMLVERDDEDEEDDEDDSTEGKKRRRIGRTLRGLFRKNVSREEVVAEITPEESPVVTVPERSFLGNIIEVDESGDMPPDLPEESETPAAPVAEATPETPVAVAPEEDEDEEPTVAAPAAASTPTPVASSSGAAGGGVPPVAVGGPSVLGGNAAPQPDPVVIEREPIIEHHHHNRRAALAALVIAERIDHHRDKKRKEQIKKVEKAQADVNKKTEQRLRTLEQAPERAVEAPQTYKERPIIPVVPRREKTTPAPEVVSSRPQSVKEVLENRPAVKERTPSLADLEHRPGQRTEQIDDDDILVAAEKLATHAKESGIAHEVFDERWHEIKDPKTPVGVDQTGVTDVSTRAQPPAPVSTQVARNTVQPTMVNSSGPSSTIPTQDKTTPSGLWVALVIGVVVAVALILSRI